MAKKPSSGSKRSQATGKPVRRQGRRHHVAEQVEHFAVHEVRDHPRDRRDGHVVPLWGHRRAHPAVPGAARRPRWSIRSWRSRRKYDPQTAEHGHRPGEQPRELHASGSSGQQALRLCTRADAARQRAVDLRPSLPAVRAVDRHQGSLPEGGQGQQERRVPASWSTTAIATYYSGDTTGAVKIATGVIKKDPTFAPAHYNIAIFFEGLGGYGQGYRRVSGLSCA